MTNYLRNMKKEFLYYLLINSLQVKVFWNESINKSDLLLLITHILSTLLTITLTETICCNKHVLVYTSYLHEKKKAFCVFWHDKYWGRLLYFLSLTCNIGMNHYKVFSHLDPVFRWSTVYASVCLICYLK